MDSVFFRCYFMDVTIMAPYMNVDSFIEEGSVFQALQEETDERDVNILQETRHKKSKTIAGRHLSGQEESNGMGNGWVLIQTDSYRGVDQYLTRKSAGLESRCALQ